jgi:hypothetical protein
MITPLSLGSLPEPLSSIVVENKRGEYRDFGLSPSDPYPLKGVTYPVDYGFLPGYLGEDGADLDFFVGSDSNGKTGSITVTRGDTPNGEQKFYVGLTESEVNAVLLAFKPVLAAHDELDGMERLLVAIEKYKKRQ